MICADCAFAADLRLSTANSQAAADIEAEVWHDACRTRNTGREPGQAADCTCQHQTARSRP